MEEFKILISQYLIEHGYKSIAEHIGLYLFLPTLIFSSFVPIVWKFIKYLIKYVKQRKAIKDLHPYFLPSEIKSATSFYIHTKCQNISPSDYDELKSNHAFAVQEDLMPFFIKKVLKYKSNTEN